MAKVTLDEDQAQSLCTKVYDAVDAAVANIQDGKFGRARQAICRALTAIEKATE